MLVSGEWMPAGTVGNRVIFGLRQLVLLMPINLRSCAASTKTKKLICSTERSYDGLAGLQGFTCTLAYVPIPGT